ncbi:MAG: hypothetical protein KAW92_04215 [Candidatus Cloacimonetes bacterium]|nr:hypothetical protein [Candidatus Cloacimonadota bacterium]
MEKDARFKKFKIIAILEIFIALGIVSFWVAFFTTDMVNISDSHLKEIYLAFEHSFTIPDLLLAISLIIGGIGLLLYKFFGILFSLMGGASLIFLGLLDTSFNIQNGIYLIGVGEAILNVLINLMCFVFGIFLILTLWKNKTHWFSFREKSSV